MPDARHESSSPGLRYRRLGCVPLVIGPHFSAALAALDLHDPGTESERRFDYVVTYERDRVLAVAETLMNRIAATTA